MATAPHLAYKPVASAVALALLSLNAAGIARADGPLPTGGNVTGGTATITSPNATTVLVNQTSMRAATDWQTFNVGSGYTFRVDQPSAAGVHLARVVGGTSTTISPGGTVSSNGALFLLNPNGVLIAQGATVDVGGLVAGAVTMSPADFMRGNYAVTAGSGSATMVNEATITVPKGGYVAFVGKQVHNRGTIVANAGSVALGAGESMLLDFDGDGLLNLKVNAAAAGAQVTHGGLIQADGGRVVLTARAKNALTATALNVDGIITARGMVERNGQIVLDGGSSGVTRVAGTLDASSNVAGRQGGDIRVLGEYVGLFGNALLDASGAAGGGTVLVGGDFQGKNAEIHNAFRTYVGPNTQIKADAITVGDGGKVIVWADDATRFLGSISARGGAEGGNGGFAEVSGKGVLEFAGRVDLRAPLGSTGTLLLDPIDLTVLNGPAATVDVATTPGDPFVFTSTDTLPATPSTITDGAINAQLSGANVLVRTGGGGAGNGDITFGGVTPIVFDAGATGNNLTFQAHRNIDVNQNTSYTNGSGALTLTSGVSTTGGNITVAAPLASTGNIVLSSTGSATGDITVSSTIGKTGSGNQSLTLRANRNIVFNGGGVAGAGTSGTYDVTLNSDRDATGGGAIQLNSGTVINSAGGTITLGGGANPATTAAMGVIGGITRGVTLTGATLNSGGGAISIRGQGANDGVARGIEISTGSQINAAGGSILLNGAGGAGAGGDSYGVAIGSGAASQVTTTGAGTIQITGNGGSNGNDNHGVAIGGSTVSAVNGAITIAGTAGGGSSQGIRLAANANVTSTGSGAITLSGTGSGGGDGIAVNSSAAGNFVSGGTVTIGGGTGNVALNSLSGTDLTLGSAGAAANVTTSGTGTIALTAAGGGAISHTNGTISGAAAVTLTADNMNIAAPISTTQTVTLRTDGAGRPIDLGNTAGLRLTSSELNQVTAGTLVIGRNDGVNASGSISVSDNIAPTGTNTLVLVTGGSITQTGGSSITATNLGLVAGTGVNLSNNANNVQNLSGRVTGTGDFIYQDSTTALSVVSTIAAVNGTPGVGIETTNGAISLTAPIIALAANLQTNGAGGAGSAVTINGPAVLGANVTIDTDSTGNNGAGNVTFTSTIVSDAIGGRNLTIDASGQAGGAGGNISFNDTIGAAGTDAIGTLTVLGNGVTFAGSNDVTAFAATLTGSGNGFTFADATGIQISGNAITTNGGTVTLNTPVTVTGATTAISTGTGAIVMSSNVNVGANTLTLTADGIDFTGGAGTVTGAGGTLVLQPSAPGTSIGIAGAAGTLQLTAADIAATDGLAQLTIGRLDGSGTTTTNAVTFTDPTLIRQPTGAGSIVVNGQITGTGDASITLTGPGAGTILNAGITTANQNITINDGVRIGQGRNIVLTTQSVAGGGNISITGATNGTTAGAAESLTLNAGTGSVNVAGVFGAGGVADSTGLTTVTVTNAGITNFNGPIAISGALVQTNAATGATTFANTVNVGSASLQGTTFDVNNSFTATGAVNVANSGLFSKNATGAIVAPGGFSTTGNVSLANNVTTTNTPLSIGGTLTIAENVDLTLSTQGAAGAGAITITGPTNGTAVGGDETLTLNAGTGAINVGGLFGAANAANASGLTTVTVTNAGITNFNGAIAISGALTQTNAATGASTFAGPVNVNSATLRGTAFSVNDSFTTVGALAVTNSGVFTKGATGAIVAPGGFSTSGAASLANNVTTTNTTISIGGALTIADGANVTLSTQGAVGAGDITLAGATNGTAGGTSEILNLIAGTGTVTIGADVGTSAALGQLNVTAATINLNAATINLNDDASPATTSSFTGAVVLGSNVTITADKATGADNSVAFTTTINGDAAGTRALVVNAGAGSVSFGGTVGAGNRLAALGIGAGSATFTGTNNVDTLAVNLTGAGNGVAYTDVDALATGIVGAFSGVTTNSGAVNLTAGGVLTVSSGVNTTGTGTTTLTTSGANTNNIVAIGNAGNAGGATVLTSAGSITGFGTISGTNVTLDAVTGVGTGTGSRVNTAADVLAARSTSGGVFVNEANAVTLSSATGNVAGGGAAYDLTAGGTITVTGAVNQTGTGTGTTALTTTAGGDILVNASVGNTSAATTLTSAATIAGSGTVVGTSVMLDSATGVGTGTAGRLATAAGTLAARSTTDGGVFVSELDAVTLAPAGNSAANGKAYDVLAGGAITATGAVNGSGTGTTTLTATTGNVILSGDVGNASAATIVRASAAAITGTGTARGTDVTLDGSTGVGTGSGGGQRINTAAGNLAARSSTGGVFVSEADAVTLVDLGTVGNGAGGGLAYDLTAAGSITVTGPVNPFGTGTTTLTSNGAGIFVNNTVGNAAAATVITSNGVINGTGTVVGTSVTLDSANGVGTGPGGRLKTTAGTLAARTTVGGAGVFVNETDAVTLNAIGGMGNSAAAGGAYDVLAAGTITVAAPVITSGAGLLSLTATGATSDVLLNANAGSTSGAIAVTAGRHITLNAGTLSTAGNVTLNAAQSAATGLINENGTGVIAGALLTTNSKGGTSLNNLNVVSSFNATNTGGGDVSLTNNSAASITGISQAGGGNVIVNNNGNLTVNGNVTAGAGTVTLTAAGNDRVLTNNANIVSTTSVELDADQMNLAPGSNIATSVGGTGKVPVVTLRPTTAGQQIALGGPDAPGTLGLTQAELNTAHATVLRVGRTSAGAITVPTSVVITNSDVLHLITGSSITGTSGGISVPGLVLEALSANLNNTANDVITLAANITAPGNAFTYAGDANSVVIGSLDGINGITTSNGNVTIGSNGALSINQPISAGNAIVTLNTGSVSQTAAGIITADTLRGTVATSAILDQANQLSNVGPFTTTTGNFTLDDIGGLTVGGAVSSGGATSISTSGTLSVGSTITGADVALTATGAGSNILLANNVNATNTLTLSANGAGAFINQTGGAITAGTLTGSSNTSASLNQAGNAVTNLGAFTTHGNFTLNDSTGGLTLTGAVSADAGAVSITTAGGALALGNNNVTGQGVSLTGTGVTQSGGTVDAGTGTILVDANDGAVNMAGTLTTTNNTANAVRIIDAAAVTLPNISAASGAVVLGLAGADNLSGAVTQTAGTTINVNSLTGVTGNSVTLGNNNLVTNLGTFTSNGNFTLVDTAGGLVLGGNVSAGPGAVSISTVGQFLMGGQSVTAQGVTLTGTGISQSGASNVNAGAGTIFLDANDGAINMAGSLTTTNTSATAVILSDATTAVLPNITAASGGVRLGLAGADNLSGPVTQTAGTTINAGTLAVNGGSSVILGNANTVTNLGAVSTIGNFTLNDTAGGLTVTGNVDAGPGQNASRGAISITTSGGALAIGDNDIHGAGGVTLTGVGVSNTAAGTVSSLAAADSGLASGNIQINATGNGSINMAGTVTARGAHNSVGSGSDAGSVTISTANGSITAAQVSSQGGDISGPGRIAGHGNSLTYNVGGAGNTLTLTGEQVTRGGDIAQAAGGSAALAGNAGDITFNTASGSITVAQVTARGGDSASVRAVSGGDAGTIRYNVGGSGNTLTLNGDQISRGGDGSGSGRNGAGRSIAFNAPTRVGADIRVITRQGAGGSSPVGIGGGTTVTFASTLDSASAAPHSVSIEGAGETTFDGVVGGVNPLAALTITGPVNGGLSTVINTTAITTTGAQTYGQRVTLGSDTTLTSTASGAITLRVVDSDTTARNLTVNTAGDTVFFAAGTSQALASLTTGGGGTTQIVSVTTTGGQTYDDAVLLGFPGTTLIGGGPITFNSSVNGLASQGLFLGRELIVRTPGLTSFRGPVGNTFPLTRLTTDGGGTTDIRGGSITTTGSQTYTDAVTLSADTVLNAGTDITFASTLRSPTTPHSLIVNAAGVTTFSGTVGEGAGNALLSVTTDQPGTTAINGGAVTTTGEQRYKDAVSLGAANTLLTSTSTGPVTFENTLNGASNLTVTTAGLTSFLGAVGGTTALSSLRTDGGGTTDINGGTVKTTGAQTYVDAVVLSADANLTSTSAGNVSFGNTVDGGFGLAVNTAGTTSFAGLVGGNAALGSIATDEPGTVVVNGGSVKTTGAQTYNDALTIGAGTTFTSTASGAVTFAKTLNGAFAATVNTAGATTFGGAVGLAALTTDEPGSTAVNGGAVTTTGAQTYGDSVTLGTNTLFASTGGGAIGFGKTLDGAVVVNVNTTGTTTFGGAVGGTTALTSLTTDLGGTTAINGGAITTTGSQTYGDAVTLGANDTLTSTGGNISFANTINADAVGNNRTLAVNAPTGTATFSGNIGNTQALADLDVNAAAVVFNSVSVQSVNVSAQGGNTATFNGPVVLGQSLTVNTDGAADNNVTFTNTVNADTAASTRTLTVSTGTGTSTFQNGIGSPNLELAALTLAGAGANVTGNILVNGGGNVDLSALGNITFSDNARIDTDRTGGATAAGNVLFAATTKANPASGLSGASTWTIDATADGGAASGNVALGSVGDVTPLKVFNVLGDKVTVSGRVQGRQVFITANNVMTMAPGIIVASQEFGNNSDAANAAVTLKGLTTAGIFGTVDNPIQIQAPGLFVVNPNESNTLPIVFLGGDPNLKPVYEFAADPGRRVVLYNGVAPDSPQSRAAIGAALAPLREVLSEVLLAGFAKENIRRQLVQGQVLETGLARPGIDEFTGEGVTGPNACQGSASAAAAGDIACQ
jgi:hypothetical protein